MNRRAINYLIKGHLSETKEREVIAWLLKNPDKQKYYESAKATYTAGLIRNYKPETSKVFNARSGNYLYAYTVILALLIFGSLAKRNMINKTLLQSEDAITMTQDSEFGKEKENLIPTYSTRIFMHLKNSLFTQIRDKNTREAIQRESLISTDLN